MMLYKILEHKYHSNYRELTCEPWALFGNKSKHDLEPLLFGNKSEQDLEILVNFSKHLF